MKTQWHISFGVSDKNKPDPEDLLSAVDEFQIDHPSIIIYVGDVREDMQATWRANILNSASWRVEVLPVGICREDEGFHELETLRQDNPVRIIKSLNEH